VDLIAEIGAKIGQGLDVNTTATAHDRGDELGHCKLNMEFDNVGGGGKLNITALVKSFRKRG
jgi:hypothetical protein